MKLTIYGRLPGLNEYTNANRRNRYAGAHMKKTVEEYISFCIKGQLKEKLKGKAYLEFRWYEQNKKRDIDNVAFAKKFIFDALVSEGILIADSWRGVVGYKDNFYVDKINPRVEVIIEEAEDEL